jgi:hypothetical protein
MNGSGTILMKNPLTAAVGRGRSAAAVVIRQSFAAANGQTDVRQYVRTCSPSRLA